MAWLGGLSGGLGGFGFCTDFESYHLGIDSYHFGMRGCRGGFAHSWRIGAHSGVAATDTRKRQPRGFAVKCCMDVVLLVAALVWFVFFLVLLVFHFVLLVFPLVLLVFSLAMPVLLFTFACIGFSFACIFLSACISFRACIHFSFACIPCRAACF